MQYDLICKLRGGNLWWIFDYPCSLPWLPGKCSSSMLCDGFIFDSCSFHKEHILSRVTVLSRRIWHFLWIQLGGNAVKRVVPFQCELVKGERFLLPMRLLGRINFQSWVDVHICLFLIVRINPWYLQRIVSMVSCSGICQVFSVRPLALTRA